MNQKGNLLIGILIGLSMAGAIFGAYFLMITIRTPQSAPTSITPPGQHSPSPSPSISSTPAPIEKISIICPVNEGYEQPTLDVNEAAVIAKETNCSAEGTVDISSASCNISGNNWSFGFKPKENKGNCGVVCYVDSKTKIAKLLWMCGGYVPSPPEAFENP
ncbi:hypothetical protein A2867_03515 [Candidatus Daviesbacteria bacterium RIFCSPHIGHO2_01_FULL_40_11]|uniref:Uncharacterized protein n=1 Tax=Candidatus Daviesbacteria bacterium RIFCSPHIGHO2_01_FULL_40_11 TaxID=1797762 RepID=A0A1F5JK32_9BACT|nr:MAG: hypothetical protein A2867_03515 [Candidatus Daviesbacteria bacterium RIFCSPHIGHO2_01_FULL_40_11]OGE62793.1 MAG: hypothetical protein A2964_01760 [Candidatus Daviesbacteria bacterium RIFCSPLOWO2_01_FULL_40_27]